MNIKKHYANIHYMTLLGRGTTGSKYRWSPTSSSVFELSPASDSYWDVYLMQVKVADTKPRNENSCLE